MGLRFAALAVHGLLQAAAESLRPLDALALQRGRKPLMPFPDVPDCPICHGKVASR